MRVSKTVTFDAAHRITLHKGKCKNLHGHTYKMEVILEGGLVAEDGASDLGMVVDFGEVNKILKEKIVEVYDHSTMIWKEDKLLYPISKKLAEEEGMNIQIMDFPSTAENMAVYFYYTIASALPKGVSLYEVKIWETPNAFASYKGEEDVV
jgi:6-pyruvoyltetrahydropterin/6-carboxytetrahydropterin synthase